MWMLLQSAIFTLSLTSVFVFPIQAQSVPDAPQPQKQNAPDVPVMNNSAVEAACASLRTQGAQAGAKHDYAAATILLRKAAPVCADQAAVQVELARAEMLSKQFQASADTLHSLLARDPRNVDALMTQGELFYLMGRSSEAITSLSQASAAAPTSAEPHYLLGRVYYQQSSLQLAKAQFQTALQLDPGAYKAYDGLALCYESLADIGQAAQTYMKGIAAVYKAHPGYDVIYADFAELMLRYNENQKALDLAAEAVQRNPSAPRNYLLAGRALAQAGRYRESLRWLMRAAQQDSTYPGPHLQFARVYKKLGDDAKAKQEADLFAKLSAQAARR